MSGYLTIPEELLLNAQRHKEKGDAYLKAKLPSHAAGSYRKAERNLERAQRMIEMMRPVTIKFE